MSHRSEIQDSTQSDKEREFIHKEDVDRKSHLLVKLMNLLRDGTISVLKGSGFFRTIFPFRAATLGPQILYAAMASSTLTGESLIWFDLKILMKSFWEGNPRLA